jgi:preprotein translocase subunit SecG
MEYVVLVATNVVLLLGLLFFVDSFPTEGWKQFAIWLATIVIILSVVFVVIMIVFDIVTRRLKDKRLVKQRKEELVKQFGEMKKEQLEKEYKKMFPSAFSTKTREVDEMDEDWQEDPEWQVDYNGLLEGVEWRVIPNPLVEDSNNSEEIDYQAIGGSTVVDFSLPFYNDDESMSDEGKHETINDIMDDLFGVERIRKKVLLLKQFKNFKKIIVQKQVE